LMEFGIVKMDVKEHKGVTYDLLPRILPYFDKHLSIEILEQLLSDYNSTAIAYNPYTEQSLLRQITKLLSKTCRKESYCYYLEKLRKVDNEVDEKFDEKVETMQKKTTDCIQKVSELKERILKVFFPEQEMAPVIRTSKRIVEILAEETRDGIDFVSCTTASDPGKPTWYPASEIQDALMNYRARHELPYLYTFARCFFELGFYDRAYEFLKLFLQNQSTFVDENLRAQLSEEQQHSHRRYQEQALWGTICCSLLERTFSQEHVAVLQEKWAPAADSANERPLALSAKQHAWLLHWVLYQNFLNEQDGQGINEALNTFLDDRYKSTITTVCPWLLRYIVLAAVCCSNKTLKAKIKYCKEIAKNMLQEEVDSYKDPLTEFLRSLFVECDYEQASNCLRDCRKVFTIDIFICSQCNRFFSQARLLLFSQYSTVNLRMPMDQIGNLLMLGEYGNLPDNRIWSVGGQPVHLEKRDLTEWITDTVRAIQKENARVTEEDNFGPTYSIQIDLRERLLTSKPTYEDPYFTLMEQCRTLLKDSKKFNEGLPN